MARGGARKGAGRPRGAVSKKSQEIAATAIAEGITPLEVMLKAMRNHAEEGEWSKAAFIAKDAAPYVHPRLAAIEHTGKDGGPIETKDVTDAEFARRVAFVLCQGLQDQKLNS
jgi:hypothetical protein